MSLLQKTIGLLFLASFFLSPNRASSQAFDESIFPYGGWQFGGLDPQNAANAKQLQEEANINTFFFGVGDMNKTTLDNHDENEISAIKGYPNNGWSKGTVAYPGISLHKYCGSRFPSEGQPATDVRFFLASGGNTPVYKPGIVGGMTFNPQTPLSQPPNKFDLTYAYDMANRWTNFTGQEIKNEWHIAPGDGVVPGTTDVLLSGLQSWNDAIDRSAKIGICDFIYRIDETSTFPDYTSGDMADNTEIYDIVYTLTRGLHDVDGNVIPSSVVQTPAASDIITYKITRKDVLGLNTGSYNARLTDPLWVGTEHANIKKYNGNEYALAHTEFDMHPITNVNGTNVTWDVIKVDCTLKKIIPASGPRVSKGIYVRGLRLRTDLADKLLRGYLDNGDYTYTSTITGLSYTFPGISTTFDGIWSNYMNNFSGSTALTDAKALWKKIPFVTFGGETTWPAWRALAYLDQKWAKFSQVYPHNRTGGQRILTFISENVGSFYMWYRSIYEDETGQVPPPLVPECYKAYSAGIDPQINPGYPRDILDHTHINSSDGYGDWGYHTLSYLKCLLKVGANLLLY